jgi:hypothetical protein
MIDISVPARCGKLIKKSLNEYIGISERTASKHNENDREEKEEGGLNQNFGVVKKNTQKSRPSAQGAYVKQRR